MHLHALDEAALKRPLADGTAQRLCPLLTVFQEQFAFAFAKGLLLGIILREVSAEALDADELGTIAVAVVVEPVGEHQARGIVVGVGDDVFEESLLVVHDSLAALVLVEGPSSS
jgi:hypothetical protein